ncbi:DEAD/DEAH box helicase [Corallococcus exiguus]|uniref:DEAD/DEAH box helicase n=1 Tax=Corallococcus exiguus TaxID=83462 RepID=UPI0015608423|nr:DEAD/DEAH box helicase [Corallococcus exiguus]NRD53785.1 DEAD/DEAH box helicase family protein [Corallococcus exiguus]
MNGKGLDVDGRCWKFLQYPESYCEASTRSTRPLAIEPTRRQFATAAAILSRLSSGDARQVGGVLLADDVGLGKTTVAALVAWVVAGQGGTVRILAPNAVLRRRWEEELKAHVPLLQACARSLDVDARNIKGWETARLHENRIQVGTHHQLVEARREGRITRCSLLIVDEAHRAKGEESAFRQSLVVQGEHAAAKLILTATPFSIDVKELIQLLRFCGAEGVEGPVERYARSLMQLHGPAQGRDPVKAARKLEVAGKAAIEAIAPYVIRYGIDDLSVAERKHFGKLGETWSVEVPVADEASLELLLRADRLLRLTREKGRERTNDPRFHVGWGHLRYEVERVTELAQEHEVPLAVSRQLTKTRRLLHERAHRSPHPKMAAVARAVATRVEAQEKVLVFCHHRATALELLQVLDAELRLPEDASLQPPLEVWRAEWKDLLSKRMEAKPLTDEHKDQEELFEAFLDWLCGPGLCRQVLSWLPERPRSGGRLRELLTTTRVRGRDGQGVPKVLDAADALFRNLTDARSRSTLGLLRAAYWGDSVLPGDLGEGHRVLGAWQHSAEEADVQRILFQGEPDVVLSLFNSPFGPDVLVATDRLSEGVDLHRCCRLLVHYELDPSPIRTLQRNGRVRRVGGWAGLTNQPIEYAYPSFNGTRDARAVEIMNMRLQRFDLLLGGVPPVNLDEDTTSEDTFVRKVLEECGGKLKDLNRLLRI